MTQRNTHDSLAWLRHQSESGASNWAAKCLQLQRTARNLPAVYPSARSAQDATPMRDRVYDIHHITQGMVGYADDPNDSNPFGHIFSFRGKDKAGNWVVWTNDALGHGRVWTVRYDWFQAHWGDRFQFAAKSLNGFNLILPSGTPSTAKPSNHPTPAKKVGVKPKASISNLDYALHRLDKAIIYHEKHHHPKIVAALKRDRAEVAQTIKKYHL